jgi:solute carrier family 25 (mitochondrial oxoglutarate transporter), member 11
MSSNSITAPKQAPQSMALNFILGGASGCTATLFIQPLDMVKVRIQLLSELGRKNVGFLTVGKELIAENGFKYLYKGLDTAIVRQIFYGTTRLGLFYSFLDHFKKKNNGEPTLFQKSISSISAGGIAAFVSNPADLILVRMQADGTLPVEQRRNYKNVFEGVSRVTKEEGFTKLWRGCLPTVARAMIINLALLAPFEEFKHRLKNAIPNTHTRTIVSSLMASFIGSFASLPLDNAKTKLQKMKAVDGVLPYNGIVDCVMKTVKNEGVSKLWVGFPTYYIRIGPHVIITLFMNDLLRKIFIK